MAARKKTLHDENTRNKIKAAQIINRLQDYILKDPNGEGSKKCRFGQMSSQQVTASLGLLRKVLPDLESVEATLSGEVRQRVISAEPLSDDAWEQQYCNDMAATEGPTESTH